MTEPQQPTAPKLDDVAAESPRESVEREREVVGDQSDTGPTVPEDDSQ